MAEASQSELILGSLFFSLPRNQVCLEAEAEVRLVALTDETLLARESGLLCRGRIKV